MQPTTAHTPAPALSLYRPPHDPADRDPSPDWTLTDFWARWARPAKVARSASPRYLRALEQSLRLWTDATADPPLADVDDRTCDSFLVFLQGRSISPNTIRKHARHVQHLLDWAAPRSRDNRRPPAVDGLFGDDHRGRPRPAPYIEPPPEVYHGPRPHYTIDEIDTILRTCPEARKPRYAADLALWWRCLWILLWNTGLRAESATLLAPSHRAGDWADLPPEIMKRRRRGHRLYLNRHARAALDRVEPPDPATPYFAWPHSYSWFYAEIRRLEASLPADRRLGTHACRRALISWLQQRNPEVAKLIAGHSGRGDVTLRHYTAPEIVVELMESYPQPTAWSPRDT